MSLSNEQKAICILSNAYGIGRIKARKVLETTDIERLARDPEECRKEILSVLGEKDYEEIVKSAKQADFAEVERGLERENVRLLTILDDEYPVDMRNYDDAPLSLYCKGDISLLNVPSFGIVGTRNPTKYGERVTEEFAEKLCKRFCIVSGMAKGVDGIAHRTALKSDGKTVAVLACGVNIIYPRENRDIYEQIAEKGLIVSEYPLGKRAEQYDFPIRNRIISGLSKAVLVTEAGKKSGTLHTINHAIKQGKDVFCVPGSIYNKSSEGCNQAIKECQTRIATCVNDIYDELGLPREEEEKKKTMQLDENGEKIVKALEKNGEMHFEELLEVVDLTVPQLNATLIKMTAAGIIVKTKHNYWSI